MNYAVSVNDFDTLVKLSHSFVSRKAEKRLQDLVNGFDGGFDDFQTYVETVYTELYEKQFGQTLDVWDNINIYLMGQWLFENNDEFENMCLYFQEQGWLHDWY